MTKHVLRTRDSKKVVIDDAADVTLYSAPSNPPDTGSQYTRGTDLLAHTARSGNVYFYMHCWSMWAGDEDEFELCSKATAEAFLTKKAGLGGWAAINEYEIETAKEYGIDIMEETA